MPSPYSLKIVKAKDNSESDSVELLVYGDIGESWWSDSSVSAISVVKQLQEVTASEILVRINSYGGSVSDGLAIYNALRSHSASIKVKIEGVAVSIASLIAMAGDTVEMAENAMLMIHAPWTYASGNSAQLRVQAEVLDRYAAAMASSYSRKSGKSNEDVLAILTDGIDHWYSASEAKDEGFVDSISEELAIEASGFDRSRYLLAVLNKHSKNLPTVAAATIQQHANKEATMPGSSQPAAATTAPSTNVTDTQVQSAVDTAVLAAQKKETERRTEIRNAYKAFENHQGVKALLDTCLDDMNISASDASQRLLNHLGNGAAPISGATHIQMGTSGLDAFRKDAENVLLARAGVVAHTSQNPLRGYSLLEIARRSLALHGFNVDSLDKMQLVAAAFTHSSSDFTNLLGNTANKTMLKGWEESEETFEKWTSKGQLPDFKIAKRADLNLFPNLDPLGENGEYKQATIGERGEQIQLATFGKMFNISRQMIINDDLDAFTRIPGRMGRAAKRTIGNLVYAVLTGNPAMSDGVALFHADHKNLVAGAAPTTANVDALRALLMKQKDPDGIAAGLNIPLKYILSPVALGGLLRQIAASEFEVGAGTEKKNTTPNYVRGMFEVIDDARLDASSATAWYGAADANQYDTIEVSYLDGVDKPFLDQQAGWSVDGVEFKVRIDAGVKALDFRALAKNPGA